MTVEQLIKHLQNFPPKAIAVWYDSEYCQFHEINAVSLELVSIRYNGNEAWRSGTASCDAEKTYPVWEHFYKGDGRQIKSFIAVQVNTYLEEH